MSIPSVPNNNFNRYAPLKTANDNDNNNDNNNNDRISNSGGIVYYCNINYNYNDNRNGCLNSLMSNLTSCCRRRTNTNT